MWIPDLAFSQALALAVPADRAYKAAVFDKLTELLAKAGQKAAKAAVQAYLEGQEHNCAGLDFPHGWAYQIMLSGTVMEMVSAGRPDRAEPAPAELAAEVMAELPSLDLESFLAATE